jgi:hypothetical protein
MTDNLLLVALALLRLVEELADMVGDFTDPELAVFLWPDNELGELSLLEGLESLLTLNLPTPLVTAAVELEISLLGDEIEVFLFAELAAEANQRESSLWIDYCRWITIVLEEFRIWLISELCYLSGERKN